MAQRRRKSSKKKTLRRRDGALCVSFANTWSARRRAPSDFTELLDWLERYGAFDAADAERLRTMAAERPGEAIEVFTFAGYVQELLWRIFNELADHRTLPPELVDEVNTQLVEALPRQHIAAARVGFCWEWQLGSAEDLGQTLWPVILSAARLLTSKYFAGVGRCAGEDCDLLFLRRHGGKPRRWCSMESCGRPVKNRRYYYGKLKRRRQEVKRMAREAEKRDHERWLRKHKQSGLGSTRHASSMDAPLVDADASADPSSDPRVEK